MTGSASKPGAAGLSVQIVAGESAVTSLWSSAPIKLLTPRMRGQCVWSYLASFGGGMVAGDETSLDIDVGPGARCFLTTQASTKIYRNPHSLPCSHRTKAQIDKGALLVLAPDPVQSFAESRYAQTQEFHLAGGSGLVLLDWFSAGRAARGERWNFHRLASRNDIFVDGERRLLDSLLLDRAHGPLDSAHRVGRFNTIAFAAIIGEALTAEAEKTLLRVAELPVTGRASLIYSASAVRGGTVLRAAGENHEEVARFIFDMLGFVGSLIGDDPWAAKLN